MYEIFKTRHSRSQLGGALAITTTVLAWGASFPLISLALQSMSALPLASARFAIVGVIVTFWLIWRRPRICDARDIVLFISCGGIGIALYNAFLNIGQETISAGAASFIINSVPVITAVLAALMLGERVSSMGWMGSAISFIGVSLISIRQPDGLHFASGAMLVFVAACCQAILFILQKPLVHKYGPFTSTAITLSIGSLLLLPWFGEALRQIVVSSHPGELSTLVILLACVPGIVGYLTWTYALQYYGAARASNFLYLVPPTSIVMAFLANREVPFSTTIIGGVITLCGVAIVNLSKTNNP